MTLLQVLGVVAIAQAIFSVLLAAFVIFRRGRTARRADRIAAGRGNAAAPIARWLTTGGSAYDVVLAMRALPREAALAFANELRDTRVDPAMRKAFAVAIRGERWVTWAVRGHDSWRWWRRLDAARALGVAGNPSDAPMLAPLLRDRHPAVRLAAAQALTAVEDPGLVALAVEQYPSEALAVRHFMTSTLREVWKLAEHPLGDALRTGKHRDGRVAVDTALAAWLHLAESLALPSLREAVTELVRHESPEVRAAAARALRRYPHAASVDAALLLLPDTVDFVRAAAAQTLGTLRATEALAILTWALGDRAWWVRFRAALALAMLGEAGRAALRRMRQSPDRFAREMAEMASGLSDGAVLELADA